MPDEIPAGCSKPPSAAAAKSPEPVNNSEQGAVAPETSGETVMIKVGQKAPDFTASAYHQGTFSKVNLSDYLGKWVSLCFYPGDFTFV